MKYVTQEEFDQLLKEKVKRNEMRELSQSEERDPEVINNYGVYVEELGKEYKVGKEPEVVKPKFVPEVKKPVVKVVKKEGKRGKSRKTK